MVGPVPRIRNDTQARISEIAQRAILAYPVVEPMACLDDENRTRNALPERDGVIAVETEGGKIVGVIVVLPAVGAIFVLIGAVRS